MSQVRRAFRGSAALALGLLAAASGVMAAGPTFRADYRFTGTSLSGFTPLGQADWKVQNGEIVGTPKDPERRLAAGDWQVISGPADVRQRQVRRRLQGGVSRPRREDVRRKHEGHSDVADRRRPGALHGQD